MGNACAACTLGFHWYPNRLEPLELMEQQGPWIPTAGTAQIARWIVGTADVDGSTKDLGSDLLDPPGGASPAPLPVPRFFQSKDPTRSMVFQDF